MQNPRNPLLEQNYNRQNQTQKTSNIQRYERSNLNNSHSERSVRGNQKNEMQITGNPLDIWVRSASLFRPLPTEDDIDKIFDFFTINTNNSLLNDRLIRNKNKNDSRPYLWSEHLNEIVQASQKETKKSSSGRQLMHLPQPPPAPDDISEYWTNRTPTFPISDLQKENRSVVHCLLSAFVEAYPEDPSQNGDIIASNSENNSDDDEDFNDVNDSFLGMHAPVPQIEYDEYLCLPFEERLEIELKFAGLEKPAHSMENGSNVFAQDIEQLKKEMVNQQPQIEYFKNEIKEKLPMYKFDEERRISGQQTFQELIRDVKKKPHKK